MSGDLLCLTPFMDNENMYSVGERIGEAFASYEQSHPATLPKSLKICKI